MESWGCEVVSWRVIKKLKSFAWYQIPTRVDTPETIMETMIRGKSLWHLPWVNFFDVVEQRLKRVRKQTNSN